MKKRLMVLIGLIISIFALISIFSVMLVNAVTHPVAADRPTSANLTWQSVLGVLKSGIAIPKFSGKTPSRYDLQYENVSFESRDSLLLKGWYIPAEDPKGTIIIAHGWGASKESMLKYAKLLNRNGYNTFLFDFRGFGESQGNFTSLGYYERYDVLAAVDYLRTRQDVDVRKIGVLGFSMGCAASILAAREERPFRAMVLDSCYTSINQNAARRMEKASIPKQFANSVTLMGSLVQGFNAFNLAPIKYIDEVHSPLLIMHGSRDEFVSVEEITEMYSRAADPKELWIVEGGKHVGLHRQDSNKYEENVVSFLDMYFVGAG
ncbi:alpha/beta fold hydrolase [Candidatus Woesearchaeota archaeon]|nr:alpha/beta fold hydrolase [Candidatus Woesearchaeota archaeon]